MVRVLLVEDEVVISLHTSMILEDEGYLVDTAFNGAEGLELVRANPPDLIITDYMMPLMDGLAMITELRAMGWAGPIVLTTSVPEENLPAGYKPAHDAYLAKPYLAEGLIHMVRALIGD